jgi:TonB-dependent starch-binding outer membrane protein SusC
MKKKLKEIASFNKQQLRRILIKSKLILLQLICASFCIFTSNTFAQDVRQNITGTVSDASTGEPIIGVNIVIEGTITGTISDAMGNYMLEVINEEAVLSFSYMGYQSQNIKVAGKTIINVSLVAEVKGIEEIVVIGYGTQKRSDLTGVVSKIDVEDLQKLSSPSVDQALQGQASGVYVTRNSGAPGDAAKIYIRGQGSINNTDPLWIIDGIKSTAGSNFNMNDVESIEILKDASAAAIYGVEAANGVILVTTKRGKKGDPKVSFSTYYGQNSPMNLPALLNTKDFADVKNEIRDLSNKSRIPRIADPDNLPNISTNWFDEIFSPAPMFNADLSVSGGNEKMNFYLSGNYYNEKGTMINTDYNRVCLRANSDFKILKKVKLGESLLFSRSIYTPFFNPEDPANRNDLTDLVRGIPTMPAYDKTNIYGGYGYADPVIDEFQGDNPLAAIAANDYTTKNYSLRATVSVEWEILKNLHLKASGGNNLNFIYNYLYRAPFFYGTHLFDPAAELRQSEEQINELIGNMTLTYSTTIAKHSITAMAGIEAQKIDGNYFYAKGKEFAGGLIILDAGKQTNKDNGGSITDLDRSESQFGRINYAYNDKYLFTFNVRRDGSSKFGSNERWGIFPSFSGGWNIHKESFMSDVKMISGLKLRGGWGKLGSNRIPSYLSNDVYFTSPLYYILGSSQFLVEGASLSKFPNKAVKWEEINTIDVGVDIGLFANQIQFTVDYYQKNTKDMLIPVKLPPSAGFTYGYDAGDESDVAQDPSLNIGAIHNDGIEFSLIWNKKVNDFEFSLSGNLSYNENKVIQLNKNQVIATGNMTKQGTSLVSRIEAGYPIAYFYGLKDDGIFQSQEDVDAANLHARELALEAEKLKNPGSTKTIDDFKNVFYQFAGTSPGDLKRQDIASIDALGNIVPIPDGRITDADKTIIGNPWPKWIYGIGINLKWKSFDLYLFAQGVEGRDVFNCFKYYLENAGSSDGNYGTGILNSWRPTNTNTNVPRLTSSDPNKNGSTVSTRYVEDGSYFRLKNLQFGYSIPSTWASKVHIERLRIYISGQNLLTYTKYSGSDPEFSTNEENNNTSKGLDRGYYPQTISFMAGLQLDF